MSSGVDEKREALKTLMNRLEKHKVDFSHLHAYQQIREILCYIEDNLHVKTNVKDPTNRTDETNLALAIYFSFFGGRSTGILSRDQDFPLLLKAFKDILTKKTFRQEATPLLRQLMKNTIRVYWEQNPDSHAINFNSRTYRPKYRFIDGNIEYLRERFQSLASILH